MASKPQKGTDHNNDLSNNEKSEDDIISYDSNYVSFYWEAYLDGKVSFADLSRALGFPDEKSSLKEDGLEDIIGIMDDVPDKLVTVNLRDIGKAIHAISPDNDKISEICAEIEKKAVSEVLETELSPLKKISRAKREGRAEWKTRDKSLGEEAGAFVDRVYGDLIRGNTVFHTGTLQSYDKSLSVAYDRWIEKVNEGKAEPLPGHPLPGSGRIRVGGDDSRPPPTEQDRRWVLRHLARERKATGRTK